MLGTTLLAFTAATAASAQLLDPRERDLLSSTRSITKRCEDDDLPPAEYTLKLAARVGRPLYKHIKYQAIQQSLPQGGQIGPYGPGATTAPLAGTDYDEEYAVNITIGGQHFSVIVDTGSSDTWLAEKGFDCFTLADKPVSERQCEFGATYNPKDSSTYELVKDKNFNISYGDHEFLNGKVATETVSIAGLTVTDQIIGVVNKAAWEGDGVTAGLLGLAYPDLTSVYNGTDPTKDAANTSWPYNPVFYTALKEHKLKAPLFSIALNRGTFAAQANSTYDPDLGYLSFGGIAPVPVENNTAVVPVQKSNFPNWLGVQYYYYTVNVTYDATGSHGTNQQTILDTGTTLNYLPTHLVREYAAAFDPPATWDHAEEAFFVACDAKVPYFAVNFNGKKFPIAAADQILPVGVNKKGKEVCITGTQPGGTINAGNIFILGDTFLHNVVMTFNPDHEEVFITERTPY